MGRACGEFCAHWQLYLSLELLVYFHFIAAVIFLWLVQCCLRFASDNFVAKYTKSISPAVLKNEQRFWPKTIRSTDCTVPTNVYLWPSESVLSSKYLGKFFVNSHPDQENGDILLIYLCTFRVDQNLQKYEHVVIRQIFINSGTAIR